jgi:hypothetical protein
MMISVSHQASSRERAEQHPDGDDEAESAGDGGNHSGAAALGEIGAGKDTGALKKGKGSGEREAYRAEEGVPGGAGEG